MLQGAAVCIMWHLHELCPQQHNFKENYLSYLYWGGDKKKVQVHIQEALTFRIKLLDSCILFPTSPNSWAPDMYPIGL